MGRLTSPPPASGMFHQSNGPTRTVTLSETQLSQSTTRPRESTNGTYAGRSNSGLENGRATGQSNGHLPNGLVNGDADHLASSEANGIFFKPESLTRARTGSHQPFAYRPRAMMTRSKTNYEPEDLVSARERSVEEHGELRHGWEDEYNSSEFLGQLNSVGLHTDPGKPTE